MPKIRDQFVMPLIEALKAFGHFEYQFEGDTATEEQAALLQVTPGFPVLNCRSVAFRKDSTPLLVACTVSAPIASFIGSLCGTMLVSAVALGGEASSESSWRAPLLDWREPTRYRPTRAKV